MFRIGYGYDVHKLVVGRPLILGGVEIPHTHGLLGHSDADVLLHAICDAILGAAALGDIGKHFPDTDARFKGISSLELLRLVNSLLLAKGFIIGNIDSTLLMERPKIITYVDQMRDNISTSLSIQKDAVSIKATTNEGLGFIGNAEGIAASAVALIHSKQKIDD